MLDSVHCRLGLVVLLGTPVARVGWTQATASPRNGARLVATGTASAVDLLVFMRLSAERPFHV